EVPVRLINPDRQGEPPEAFLRYHPAAHVLEPIELAGLAVDRFGQERDVLDDRHDLVAPIHVDEPFIDEAKEQPRLAAPAMRIAGRILFDREQPTLLLQMVEDPVEKYPHSY